jgi:glucose-1-phosphate thymidylyltransferase
LLAVRATRAVILARGLGTRMRREDPSAALSEHQARAAELGAKAMMPVGRPFLDFVLSALADAGVEQVCLIVAPEHDAMRDHYARVRPARVALSYAVQQEARGTADAVLAARPFTGDDPFLVLNADNYYPVAALRALSELGGPGLVGFDREALVRLGHIDAGRIRRYALLRVDARGFLAGIVEKPDRRTDSAMGPHALVSMNLWSFTPAIFDACERVAPSVRGELELPDAVGLAMRLAGPEGRFRVLPMSAAVLDLSSRGDVPAVASRLRDVVVRL